MVEKSFIFVMNLPGKYKKSFSKNYLGGVRALGKQRIYQRKYIVNGRAIACKSLDIPSHIFFPWSSGFWNRNVLYLLYPSNLRF